MSLNHAETVKCPLTQIHTNLVSELVHSDLLVSQKRQRWIPKIKSESDEEKEAGFYLKLQDPKTPESLALDLDPDEECELFKVSPPSPPNFTYSTAL